MGATWRKLIILGLLLEFSPENRDPKSRGSTQMKSRDPVFGATAGDALMAGGPPSHSAYKEEVG